MTTARRRKPASDLERDALKVWQEARPVTAMTMLADAGYDETARAEFLRRVAQLADPGDIADFASGFYVAEEI